MTMQLTVTADISHAPLTLLVPADTSITRQGQAAFRLRQKGRGDLIRGTLLALKFSSNQTGGAVASEITVLAVPGAEFVFDGNISQLDLPNGKLALVDPRDSRTYQLTFHPGSLNDAQSLRVGQRVMVTAVFDGVNYVARDVKRD
jgi:hypothetical protein